MTREGRLVVRRPGGRGRSNLSPNRGLGWLVSTAAPGTACMVLTGRDAGA